MNFQLINITQIQKNDDDSYDEIADLQRSEIDYEWDLIGFIVKSGDSEDE